MIAILIVYGINSGYKSATRQGLEFLLFSIFMALGAIYSWAYLPNLQRRMLSIDPGGGDATEGRTPRSRLETKSLEDLGEGRERAKRDGEITTVKEKVDELKRRRRRGMRGAASSGGGYGLSGQDIGMR